MHEAPAARAAMALAPVNPPAEISEDDREPGRTEKPPDEVLRPRSARPPLVQAMPSPTAGQDSNEVLRRATQPSSVPPTTAAGMIPTDIGPLPVDLWALLGETPPLEATSVSPNVESSTDHILENVSPAAVEIEDGEQASFLKEVRPGSMAVPRTSSGAPGEKQINPTPAGIVQAERMDAAMEVEQAGQQPPVPKRNNQLSGTDLTKLVQQVYIEVRRRLALDWERNRR